jgi:hypothetical protein
VPLDISNHAGSWGVRPERREDPAPIPGSLHLVAIGIVITLCVALLSAAMVAVPRPVPIATEATNHGTVAPASIPASSIDPTIGVAPVAPRALPTSQPITTSVPSDPTSAPVTPLPVLTPLQQAAPPRTVLPTRAVPTQAIPTQAVPTQAVPTPVVPTPAVPTPALPTPALPTPALPTPALPTPPPAPSAPALPTPPLRTSIPSPSLPPL